jgi:hypothetical protein
MRNISRFTVLYQFAQVNARCGNHDQGFGSIFIATIFIAILYKPQIKLPPKNQG